MDPDSKHCRLFQIHWSSFAALIDFFTSSDPERSYSSSRTNAAEACLGDRRRKVVYMQGVNSNKRAARSKVVKMMISNVGTKGAGLGTTDSEKQAQNAP